MDGLVQLADGFAVALTPVNILYCLVGVMLGTLVGVLPGIGPALTIALLLPVTYGLEPSSTFIMFAGIYYGALYGGSTTSILLNTPGEAGSVITALDGNAMARSGRGAAALATAAIGSFVAGTIATGLLALSAPAIADLALKLGSADYFALIVVAFFTVSALLGSSVVRGMASLAIGLVIGLVGIDFQSGQARLTFGVSRLLEGIDIVLVIVALFAIGEVLHVVVRHRFTPLRLVAVKGRAWMNREELRRSWRPWLRGTAIGFPMGTVPVGGSEIPTFISYAVERKLSKNPEEFGRGAIEGVAGPEAANNANASGVLVPLLTLGIPTSATAAVILVALQQYGIQPGPLLMENEPALVWGLIASMFIGNAMLLVINLPLVGLWVRLLKIPVPYLYAGIASFALLGAYTIHSAAFDMYVMLVLGLLAFVLRRYDYPIVPLIIGAILGPIAEVHLRRALTIGQGDPKVLVETPLSIALYVIILGMLFLPAVLRRWERRTEEQVLAGAPSPPEDS